MAASEAGRSRVLLLRPLWLRSLRRLSAHAVILRPELGSQLRTEVVRLEHLANLDLGPPAERGTLQPLDRLLLRLHLPEPEAGDKLLCLGEGTVDHSVFPAGEPDAHALRARVEPLDREPHPGRDQLRIALPHRRRDIGVAASARL